MLARMPRALEGCDFGPAGGPKSPKRAGPQALARLLQQDLSKLAVFKGPSSASSDLPKMSQFLDVDAAYDDAPPPYIAFEDDDAATLVGTDAGASDSAAVDDAATLVGTDTGTSAEDGTGVLDHVAAVDTRSRASTDDDRSVTAVYDFDVRGGDVLYPAAGGDVLYPAADDFDARELYDAADETRGDRRIESRPAAGLRAGPAAPIGPAPAGKFARVRRVLRSVGRRLRRFFPK
ncbi:hypothetical protein B0H15DRAFT_796762 [Mycena belliarum]|uniref:Uncharacterized protein n=1 Tax=Mycena belliarum TaxID=1033014 RepID=A0AAD6XSG0_9AGAR|nr:hypothetical protein B0H15DRAFT_796762 [Mycena belliae]